MWTHGWQPARTFCPWDFPGKNTRVGCHFLLQESFRTQGSNLRLLHWQADFLQLSHQRSICLLRQNILSHPVFKWVSGKPTCDSLSALKQQPPLPEIVFGSFKSAHLTPRGKEVGSYWTQHLFLSQCLHFGIQLRTIFHKRHSRCMASYCPAFHCVWDKKEKITGAFTSMLIVLKCGVLKIALNTWWKL